MTIPITIKLIILCNRFPTKYVRINERVSWWIFKTFVSSFFSVFYGLSSKYWIIEFIFELESCYILRFELKTSTPHLLFSIEAKCLDNIDEYKFRKNENEVLMNVVFIDKNCLIVEMYSPKKLNKVDEIGSCLS